MRATWPSTTNRSANENPKGSDLGGMSSDTRCLTRSQNRNSSMLSTLPSNGHQSSTTACTHFRISMTTTLRSSMKQNIQDDRTFLSSQFVETIITKTSASCVRTTRHIFRDRIMDHTTRGSPTMEPLPINLRSCPGRKCSQPTRQRIPLPPG